MKELMKRMMAAILIICGSVVLLTACSDNDDSGSGNGSGNGSKDATGQVVLMYYGIGGENLDEDTEGGWHLLLFSRCQAQVCVVSCSSSTQQKGMLNGL